MAASAKVPHLSVDERRAHGKEARNRTPPASHTGWAPATDRPDPVTLLEEQNVTREPDLAPVRHARMLVSPFTLLFVVLGTSRCRLPPSRRARQYHDSHADALGGVNRLTVDLRLRRHPCWWR
jgi:hypothetical protein